MTHAVIGYLLSSESWGGLLAQADPQLPLTSSQAYAIALGFTIFVASVMTGTLWCQRYFRTGHTLPLANRGFLRVPSVVTYFTGVLSLIWVMAQLVVTFQPVEDQKRMEDGAAVAAAEQSTGNARVSVPTAAPEGANALDSTPESSAVAVPAVKVDKNTPLDEKLRNARGSIVSIILMNVLLSILLGGSVFFATRQERDPAAERRRAVIGSAAGGLSGVSLPASISDFPRSADSLAPFPEQIPDVTLMTKDRAQLPEADLVNRNTTQQSPESDTAGSEPLHVLMECRYALDIFLAAWFPTMLLRFLLVELISALTGDVPDSNPLLELLDSGVGSELMMLIAVTAVIVAPIAEELQFRVVLLGGVIQAGRSRIGWILSSVLFALAHGFPDSLALLPLAFALGYAYMRRRSYLTVVLVHFLFNLSNIAMAVLAMG